MYMRIFVFVIVLVAILVGLATQLPRDLLIKVIIFRDFFDTALPVLAFGALIKYLCTCCQKCDSCNHYLCPGCKKCDSCKKDEKQ